MHAIHSYVIICTALIARIYIIHLMLSAIEVFVINFWFEFFSPIITEYCSSNGFVQNTNVWNFVTLNGQPIRQVNKKKEHLLK